LSEDLLNVFSDALFIGIQRNPYAAVASMLKHHGACSWYKERWKEYPIPNSFLGITKTNAIQYESISNASKSALRWKSHKVRMNQLGSLLKSKLHIIQYENLIVNTEDELLKLEKFLSLNPKSIPIPIIKIESLDRWKSELTVEMKEQIYKYV